MDKISQLKQLQFLTISLFSLNLLEHIKEIEEIPWFEETLSFFTGVPRFHRSEVSSLFSEFPSLSAPDICASCFEDFGETPGGRIRLGCPVCKDCTTETRKMVAFFEVYSGLSSSQATFYLSQFLYRMNIIRRTE